MNPSPDFSERPPGRGKKDRRDKIPALISAAAKARKARDDETALLLLEKVKQIDPRAIDAYLLRADIYEERGDVQREVLEYKAALEADPTSWVVRFRILNAEYPRTRNLKHAAGIIRDLAWEKRFPERWFNAARGDLRSESELGHDEALLGHLALAGRPGHGTVELCAVAASPEGDVLVLNAHEPWLERFGPDGALIFGIDLWLTEDEEIAQHPSDVAAGLEGDAFVAEPRTGRVLRFGPDGRYIGPLGGRSLHEPCAVACAPGPAAVLVLCAGDGTLRRFDAVAGKATGRATLGAGVAELRYGGLAAGPDGTGYVLAGDHVLIVPPGAKKDAERIELPKGLRRAPGKKAGPPRRGIELDARTGSLLVALGGRHAVARIDLEGEELERIGAKKKAAEGAAATGVASATLRFPRDVAVDGEGRITIADYGNARVVQRAPGAKTLTLFLGGEGWTTP